MFTRIWHTGTVAAACLVASLGLLALPGAALSTWAVATLVICPLVMVRVHSARPDMGNARRTGVAASAAMLAASLIIAGLVALLGAAAALVAPLLLGVAGVWVWRHRPATPPTGSPDDLSSTTASHPDPTISPPAPRLPIVAIAAMSTTELCTKWRRSYWLLRELPSSSPARPAVVEIRGLLLTELERRDPDGFSRWLDTDPRAGSDPRQYLIADH